MFSSLSLFSIALRPEALRLKWPLTTLLQKKQFLYSHRYQCVPSRLLTHPGLEDTTSYLAFKIQHHTQPLNTTSYLAWRFNILIGVQDTTSYSAWKIQHHTHPGYTTSYSAWKIQHLNWCARYNIILSLDIQHLIWPGRCNILFGLEGTTS